MRPSNRPVRSPRESGFTIVAILLLVSVMASLAATFSRHVIVDAKATTVSATAQESLELLESQLDYVLQAGRIGQTVDPVAVEEAILDGTVLASEVVEHATREMVVQEVDTETLPDRTAVRVGVVTRIGMGATRLVESSHVPAAVATGPATLPALDEQVAWDVLGSGKAERMDITGNTTLSGGEYTGTIVVHEAATLTLDDYIVKGAILSAAAASGTVSSSYSDFLAPRLVIAGPARILSGVEFPGLAVLMPDGTVSATDPAARAQIVGDVVAYDLDLLTPGSVDGLVMTVLEPSLSPDVDLPGSRRGPRAWSSVLDDHGIQEPRFLAVVPREVTWTDVSAITKFKFPKDTKGGAK